MSKLMASNFRNRRDFSNIKRIIEIPNLIEIQRRSYAKFLQAWFNTDMGKMEEVVEKESIGLQSVFQSVFPIKDFNETASLEFVSYSL